MSRRYIDVINDSTIAQQYHGETELKEIQQLEVGNPPTSTSIVGIHATDTCSFMSFLLTFLFHSTTFEATSSLQMCQFGRVVEVILSKRVGHESRRIRTSVVGH